MKNVHLLLVPCPLQGHVIPLMEAARCFTSNGLKVTFVNTEFTHKRVTSASNSETDGANDLLQMVSIPDGLEPCDDRSDLGKLTETMFRVMPTKLEELIDTINQKDDNKITCIIGDYTMGWVMRVAKKLGIQTATFCPHAAALMALVFSAQKLIDDEIIDTNGVPLKNEPIRLSASMPSMDPSMFVWAKIGDSATNKLFFQILSVDGKEASDMADKIICNSLMELEIGAFTLFPKILPIGPLLATNKSTKQASQLWKEDSTCLAWLDQQTVCSVIYVAFGSITILNQPQFEELALGLELTNKPFLWVVRPDTDCVYPSGYLERVGGRGKIVTWAPQQEVLNHPSVACFVSHCGWNSTMEGVSNGVPFLCWPYFADQFFNATYICDIWKTGLGLKKDIDTGTVTREEIKGKVEQLLSNKVIKENAFDWHEKVMDLGNSSQKNLSNFVDWVKEGN